MEFLFVALINIMAILIAIQVFAALHKDYKILMVYLNSYLKGREVIDIMSKDCRIAIRVMDSYAGYATATDSLVLKIPSIDASKNIVDVKKEFDYIIYRIEGGDLWKTVIPGPVSSRAASDGVLKKNIESLYMAKDSTPLSAIAHKSTITHLTIWVSIVETLLGKEYRINPGTTVKLMNYEWEFVI